mmetsp:Transcript_14394/g.36285  ORF Transcript_14394/g.36285 Transcript_14394/m.36285 type:complete len:246 (+) Transcript_14394:405-1142(+)
MPSNLWSEVLCILCLALALLAVEPEVIKRSVALLRHQVLHVVLRRVSRTLGQCALLPQIFASAFGAIHRALAPVATPLRRRQALAVHGRICIEVPLRCLHRGGGGGDHARPTPRWSDTGHRCPMWARAAVVVHIQLAAASLLDIIVVEVPGNLLRDGPASEVFGRQAHRFAEGDVALSQVGQRPLHDELVLLVVAQEVHPKRRLGAKLLTENLRITTDNQAVLCAGKCDVEASRIIEKTDALVLI